VAGGRRKLYNEELRDLYSSPSIIRIINSKRMKWAGHVARKRKKSDVYRLLVGKPDRKRSLGRPRRRFMGTIKMDLVEVLWGVLTELVWLRIGKICELL
jgi:hypothetical protein